MSEYDKYLLDEDGEPYRYANGRPVKLDDFDQDPSPTGRAEALSKSVEEVWQERLNRGRWVPPEVIEKYNLKVPE